MAAKYTFNVPTGTTVARELLIAYLNTGESSAPVWSPLGKRVTDSSEEFDWGEESSQDILGHTYTTMKKPTISQSFDPWELEGGDAAQSMIYDLAIVQQNAQALANMDMLIAHFYTTASGASAGSFAERYESCSVRPTGLGGEGGGNVGMPIEVTYGGARTTGNVTKSTSGGITFTPDSTLVSV